MIRKKWKVLFLVAAVLLAFQGTAFARPAFSGVTQVTDPADYTLSIRTVGDERFSYTTDLEGNLLYRGGDGFYFYIVYGQDGAYEIGEIVGQPEGDTRRRVKATDDPDGLRDKLQVMYDQFYDITTFALSPGRSVPEPIPGEHAYSPNNNPKDPLHGYWTTVTERPDKPPRGKTIPLLVLRVSFSDIKCLFSAEAWRKRIFDDGVSSYYTAVSNGSFTYVPATDSDGPNDGVVSVTLPINRPGYMKSEHGQNYNMGAKVGLYRETTPGGDGEYVLYNDSSLFAYAVRAADDAVDFEAFDTNMDGSIEPTELAIMVVLAGYEASMGEAENAPMTWAHSGTIDTYYRVSITEQYVGYLGCVIADGKKVYKYTTMGENLNLSYDYSKPATQAAKPVQAQFGTACHELGHDLGLMDLYDTSYKTMDQTAQVLSLSVMANGCDGYAKRGDDYGSSPTFLDPHSKMILGFCQPTVVEAGGPYILHAASERGQYNTLRINTNDPNVYYLVENRDFDSYDKGIIYLIAKQPPVGLGGGLVFWRIDETIAKPGTTSWLSNTLNTVPGHYGIMPAYVTYRAVEENIDGYNYISYAGTNPFRYRGSGMVFPVEESDKILLPSICQAKAWRCGFPSFPWISWAATRLRWERLERCLSSLTAATT